MKQCEPEFPFGDRLQHEVECGLVVDIQVEAIQEEKCVSGSKPDPLVAVQKRMIIDQRFQQGGGLFAQIAVVAVRGRKTADSKAP